MLRYFIAILMLLVLPAIAAAQVSTGTPEDHQKLREMKEKGLAAVNAKNYDELKSLLYDPFMATVVTQDSFTSFDKMKDYFENLFTRKLLRLKDVQFSAEADAPSTIYTGTVAITKGSDTEHYVMADGRTFDIKGRWTAVSIKDGDDWKIAAIHMGTNFLDNPVLSAINNSVLRVASLAGVGGLVIGLLAGWFFGRRRAKSATA